MAALALPLALQNSVAVKTVSSMLGLYDAGFTLSTYTHATNKMQEEAAEKLGNFIRRLCKPIRNSKSTGKSGAFCFHFPCGSNVGQEFPKGSFNKEKHPENRGFWGVLELVT